MSYILDMEQQGRRIAEALHKNGFAHDIDRQIFNLAEEVGEVIGAYRRATGRARRTDTMEHVYEELADVVITAYVTAAEMNINLDDIIAKKLTVIFSRGWHEDVNAS